MRFNVEREYFFALIPEIEIWHINFAWALRIGWLAWSLEIRPSRGR